MKQNTPGYRLGLRTRRFMGWFSVLENKLQQHGVPDWLVKIPRYLLIAAVIGLLLIGAFYLALFLALMVFIAWYLTSVVEGLSEPLSDGYHYSGPEGPGEYRGGIRIDDDEE